MNTFQFLNPNKREAINNILTKVGENNVNPLHMAFVGLLACIVLALLEIADAINRSPK